MNETTSEHDIGDGAARHGTSTKHHTFCRFCVAMCGAIVTVSGDSVLEVRGDPEHPLSRGYLCPKGRAIGAAHHDVNALLEPLLGRGHERRDVEDAELIEELGARLEDVLASDGPNAIAIYLGTAAFFDKAAVTAAFALVGALQTQSVYTTFTIDGLPKGVATLLMAGQSMLAPMVDVEQTKLTLFIGCNPVVSHGHLWGFPDPVRRIKSLQQRGRVWVIDPRATETARLADRHLQARPGSDYAVLAFLVREVLQAGADEHFVREHCDGVEALRTAVEPFTMGHAASISGIAPHELLRLLNDIRDARRFSLLTGTGSLFAFSAPVTEWLGYALLAVTGSLDRRGGMWFNPDFFASADVPGVEIPDLFATGDANEVKPDSSDALHGDGTALPRPPSRPDLPNWAGQFPCAALSDEIETEHLKALIVIGGNPITAFPDTHRTRRALERIPTLAVFDTTAGEITDVATHVFPCADQLERADINVAFTAPAVFGQYTAPVTKAQGARRPVWWFLGALAERLGLEILPTELQQCSDDALIELSCQNARVPLAELQDYPSGVVADTAVFGWFTDRVLPGRRWQLAPTPLVDRLSALVPSTELKLISRRQLRHVNSTLRYVTAPGGRLDAPSVFISPTDAATRGIVQGDSVRVSSRSGEITGTCIIDPSLRHGAVSIPHGFETPNVSALTSGAEWGVDPLTGMVLQGDLPVMLEKADRTATQSR